MSQRVYEYGCLPPERGLDVALDQLRLANRYRNALVELERTRRAAKDPLVFAPPLELQTQMDALQEEAAQIRAAVKAARAKAKGRVPATATQRERLAEIRVAVNALRPAISDARKATREANRDAIAAIDEAFYSGQRAARGASGVYYGTYLCVEAAHEASATACERETWRSDNPLEEPSLPHYTRFDGTGTVASQIQKVIGDARRAGLPVDRIVGGTDTRLRIDALPTPVLRPPRRDGTPRHAPPNARPLRRVWLRIQSEERAPVWVVLPVILHRPLPIAGIVTWAKVLRKRVGPHYRWSLQLTVDIPDAPRTASDVACGINFGWRRMDDGIRVAYLVGSDGHHEEMRLPDRLVAAFRKIEDLQAIRDKAFDAALPVLAAWLRGHTVPEWMATATSTLPQWQGIGRLGSLAQRWRDNRFDGDEEIFATVEEWRRQDKHLWAWQAHGIEQALAQRRDIYRNFARRVADRYGRVALENTDMRHFARRAPVERAEEDQERAQRWQRKTACLSSLRQCVQHAVAAAGGVATREIAAGITQTCWRCGRVEEFDAEREMIHTWGCGHTWDIDDNAARNLLARASGEEVARREEVLAGA